MSKPLACHYAIIRFCPYPETDEFINVGVVLSCPELGFLDFKRARRQFARVNHFFPELGPHVYSEALGSLHATLEELKRNAPVAKDGCAQMLMPDTAMRQRDVFFTLVRPRETILHFSEPRAIMSAEPPATLNALYDAYVGRSFAQTVEYQEVQMCNRLETLLRDNQLMDAFQRNKAVGDERYRVYFPFVRFDEDGQRAVRAMKALYLNKAKSTEIFIHADHWHNHVRRLRDFGTIPNDLLFVVRGLDRNAGAALQDAYGSVMEDYQRAGIPIVEEGRNRPVLEFARLG
jgi:hypothetical protein